MRMLKGGLTGLVGVPLLYLCMESLPRAYGTLLGVLIAVWAIIMLWLVFSGSKRMMASRRRLNNEFLRWTREQRRPGD